MPAENEWFYQSHTGGAEQGPKIMPSDATSCLLSHQMVLMNLFKLEIIYII